ncbi:hypothetical protein BSIN_4617 [Burkholderia singularis]|uniref:Uncharacterized protein n=1 Tax=Burkholderia singularis TaxID=1503053 RepID=A0A238H8Y5_9BURK|nr:hypothetical protein BSIN_4617 [Burkholderia singularis]
MSSLPFCYIPILSALPYEIFVGLQTFLRIDLSSMAVNFGYTSFCITTLL